MAKKKGVNPLAVGLGVALGAAGAFLLSKKENRTKVKKAIKKLQADKGQGIMTMVTDLVGKLGSIQEQADLDRPQGRVKRKK